MRTADLARRAGGASAAGSAVNAPIALTSNPVCVYLLRGRGLARDAPSAKRGAAVEGTHKELTVSITVAVEEGVDQETLADRVGEALKPMVDEVVGLSDVTIHTVPRRGAIGVAGGGYESRLWEKATCKTENPLVPREAVVEELLDEAERLGDEVRALARRVRGLS
jgi:hypothetical protein